MKQWKALALLITLVMSVNFSDVKAQKFNFYVMENGNGEKVSVEVKNVKKFFFPTNGQFAIQAKDGETQTFEISTVGRMGFESVDPSGLNQVEIVETIRSHPNPVVDFLTIESDEAIGDIQIYNLNGKMVKSFTTSDSLFKIDFSDLNNGIYFVKTKTNAQKVIKK